MRGLFPHGVVDGSILWCRAPLVCLRDPQAPKRAHQAERSLARVDGIKL